jgi:hypothetical protein
MGTGSPELARPVSHPFYERLNGERGIALGAADLLGIRPFLRIALDETTPDHSTVSRTRRLMDVETRQSVFVWLLRMLGDHGMLPG